MGTLTRLRHGPERGQSATNSVSAILLLIAPSIGTIGDAYDNADAETVMGLFKNEAVAKESPFRAWPLMAASDVVEIVVDWVHWYNERLHSTLGYCTSVEFEEPYYDEISGSLPDEVARQLAA